MIFSLGVPRNSKLTPSAVHSATPTASVHVGSTLMPLREFFRGSLRNKYIFPTTSVTRFARYAPTSSAPQDNMPILKITKPRIRLAVITPPYHHTQRSISSPIISGRDKKRRQKPRRTSQRFDGWSAPASPDSPPRPL